jgi:hypothetical protein
MATDMVARSSRVENMASWVAISTRAMGASKYK